MSTRIAPRVFGAAARRAFATLVPLAILVPASMATAQAWPSAPELRPFVGVYVPTGSHRALLEQAMAIGGQVALEFGRGVHAVAGMAWIPTEQRGVATGGRLEMAQFDLGAEWLSPGARRLQRRVNPLVGGGVGLRAYRSRDVDTPSQANPAGYGTLGIEVRLGRMAARLEGRDYVSAFRGLGGRDGTSLRNDMTLGVGVGYHVR